MKIILISFTSLNSLGGVPKFCRDFISYFKETKHFSYWDVPGVNGSENLKEFEKAKILNQYLINKKLITKENIVIVDGFWGNGLENWTKNLVVHRHGIWQHCTKKDLENGTISDFPDLNDFQIKFTKKHLDLGGRVTSVSDFISYQLNDQWNFKNIHVINNGVDLNAWKPCKVKIERTKPLIIHGVTNANKGFEHIQIIKDSVDANILLLDEAALKYNMSKQEVMAQADLVVHPSNWEGNSMFLMEALSSDIPIISYNVGLMWKYWDKDLKYASGMNASYSYDTEGDGIGIIMNRNFRSPVLTIIAVNKFFDIRNEISFKPREWVKQYSLDIFYKNWEDYLKKEFGYERKQN